jgi:hypothetical protein
MSFQGYRITNPTIARFEEVLWAEKKVMMFTQDLRTRCQPAPEDSK